MYWLSVSKLAEDLREGRVDQKEQFKYYLATFILWNIFVQLFFYFGGPYFPIDRLIPVGLSLIVTVLGIVYCYGTNKIGDDKDFIARMICLGWPIGVWILVYSLSLVLMMIIITVVFPSEARPTLTVALGEDLRWGLWFPTLAYFGRISGYLSRIGGVEKPIGIGEAFSISIRGLRK